MLKGLANQMEQLIGDETNQQQQQQRLVVNSNLVSISIVPDPRYAIKVDFTAPIELTFKHLEPTHSGSTPHCVYWDTNIR